MIETDRHPRNGAYDELEFERVKEEVSEYASSEVGRQSILSLNPGMTRLELDEEHAAVEEMGRLLDHLAGLRFSCHYGADLLRRLGPAGATLEPTHFLDLRETAESLADTKRRVAAEKALPDVQRVLTTLRSIPDLEDLGRAISHVLDRRGQVRDDASSTLSRLRRRRKDLTGEMEERLRNLIRNPSLSEHVAEDYFTVINSRYVLLLKSGSKGQLPGVVQGRSRSGLSLYVEPFAMVEKNNELLENALADEAEVRRLLRELSERVRVRREDLAQVHKGLGWLDSLAARARHAREHKESRPTFADDGSFRLVNARHPLLGEACIPIEVEMRPEDSVLIIGGANSGGKTVALKTVGLLHLMALSGFPVPVDPRSTLGYLRSLECEIGDKQSLDENLSSFGSHIWSVARILQQARRGSLVLLDEFMASTDPQEGSALAEAVLAELSRRGARVVITTHYNAVKVLGQTHQGFRNYGVEFDWETLQPTFRILPDVPGSSMGIEMAGRFGLEEAVLEEARQVLARDRGDMTDIITRLERQRAELEADRRKHSALVAEAEKARNDASRLLEQAREERRKKLSSVVREQRQELSRLTEWVKEQLRQGKGAQVVAELQKRQTRAEERSEALLPAGVAGELEVGDRVLVLDLETEGDLVDLSGKRAVVEVGGMPVKTTTDRLRRMKQKRKGGGRRRANQRGGQATWSLAQQESSPQEIDLRGLQVREALETLGAFLDRASAAGHLTVRVIHGKGEGVLRKAVRDFLSSSSYVSSFRTAGWTEGQSGATLATLGPPRNGEDGVIGPIPRNEHGPLQS